MRQTTMANKATIEHKWYVVDATDMVLGRLASQVATVLRGKHKPTYTPHVDTGDYVIIVNADKVRMTGNKLANEKYYHHTGWLGGLKVKTAKEFLEKDPTGFVEHAVKGMLPHNTLG
ncbi:MAG TPA: 50S ribosomal protein L13, partial [Kandleria vitulina]|nr:50S ribosomal protein L13 [Kandleria vitulina]